MFNHVPVILYFKLSTHISVLMVFIVLWDQNPRHSYGMPHYPGSYQSTAEGMSRFLKQVKNLSVFVHLQFILNPEIPP